jgi:hypothetical protein
VRRAHILIDEGEAFGRGEDQVHAGAAAGFEALHEFLMGQRMTAVGESRESRLRDHAAKAEPGGSLAVPHARAMIRVISGLGKTGEVIIGGSLRTVRRGNAEHEQNG